jgi:hypothetical protein
MLNGSIAEDEEVNARTNQRKCQNQNNQDGFGEIVVARLQHIADGNDIEDDDDNGQQESKHFFSVPFCAAHLIFRRFDVLLPHD